jgi:fructose-1,6-bisphosphatase/inositol monophosphatase family enzyme
MKEDLIIQMLIEAGTAVRSSVIASLKQSSAEQLSSVYEEKKEDTIYAIDREVEKVLVPILETYADRIGGLVVLAEGIGDEEEPVVLPSSISPDQAAYRILIDPIDGTRGIMYNKRAAFFLAGAAPNKGEHTKLSDIAAAVMVELPTSRQYLADVLYAVKGKGSSAYRENILSGEKTPLTLSPSRASSIIGGFAQLTRFFPPGREILSRIEDTLIHTLVPSNPGGKALVFEDQYISSGGQLYEILMGHDRFVADVRGLLYKHLRTQGQEGGHVCHPYDVAAHLIGVEAGVIITDGHGNPLDAPMDLNSEINWIGYANASIEKEVKSILMDLLQKHHLA